MIRSTEPASPKSCAGRGTVGKTHLHRYVNEATFRLNEGNVKIHTLDRLAFAKMTVGKRITYKELTA